MPMSGSYSNDGDEMAQFVIDQGYSTIDFFIFAASGTNDFAYNSFKNQIEAMADASSGMFVLGNDETQANMSFLVRDGYSHDTTASNDLQWIVLFLE